VFSSFLLKTFWTQSMQFVTTAARNPTILKVSSVAEQSTSPSITGTSERLTCTLVVSRRMILVKTTVKKGAEALIVSVNEAATLASDTSPVVTDVPVSAERQRQRVAGVALAQGRKAAYPAGLSMSA
jgi:di/tricarboxylate transporter